MHAGNCGGVRAVLHRARIARHAADIRIAGNCSRIRAIIHAAIAAAQYAADRARFAGRGHIARVHAAAQLHTAARNCARHAADIPACGGHVAIIVQVAETRLAEGHDARCMVTAGFNAAIHGQAAHIRAASQIPKERLITRGTVDRKANNAVSRAVKAARIGRGRTADGRPAPSGKVYIVFKYGAGLRILRDVCQRTVYQRGEPRQLIRRRNLIDAFQAVRLIFICRGRRRFRTHRRRFFELYRRRFARNCFGRRLRVPIRHICRNRAERRFRGYVQRFFRIRLRRLRGLRILGGGRLCFGRRRIHCRCRHVRRFGFIFVCFCFSRKNGH